MNPQCVTFLRKSRNKLLVLSIEYKEISQSFEVWQLSIATLRYTSGFYSKPLIFEGVFMKPRWDVKPSGRTTHNLTTDYLAMEKITHIRTTKKTYYGAIILSILVILNKVFSSTNSLPELAPSAMDVIAIAVILYFSYKIFFGKGKIILTQSEFKVQGYSWTNWDDLISVYPFIEHDSENGEQNYIRFRLTDGSDLSVRNEYLEMTFEQIAELVNLYKMNYQNTKK